MKILTTLSFLFSMAFSNSLAQPNTINMKGKTYYLSFNDEFSTEKPDTTKWNYRTDSKHWSTQLPANVKLENGYLKLKLKKETIGNKNYTGAGLISKDSLGAGYYETTMQIPKGAGWHTSFWLMKHDGSGGTGPGKTNLEIDIVESDSKVKLGHHTNLHKWYGEHKDFGYKYIQSADLSQSPQVAGCLITKDSLFYFYNGLEVDKRSLSNLKFGKMHIWLTSIASHLGGTESVDDNLLPSEAIFDYVRYYSESKKEKK
jgi:hypothetical protein